MSLVDPEKLLENIKNDILYLSTKKSLHEENENLYGVRAKTAREYKREVLAILNHYIEQINKG